MNQNNKKEIFSNVNSIIIKNILKINKDNKKEIFSNSVSKKILLK